MSGLNHDWDRPYGPGHADFKHGAVDESDFEEVNYKPKKKKKGCKRSKDGGACEFTKVITLNQWYSQSEEKWAVAKRLACSRCGKYKWGSLFYSYEKNPAN